LEPIFTATFPAPQRSEVDSTLMRNLPHRPIRS
jgi:hypothetical protein